LFLLLYNIQGPLGIKNRISDEAHGMMRVDETLFDVRILFCEQSIRFSSGTKGSQSAGEGFGASVSWDIGILATYVGGMACTGKFIPFEEGFQMRGRYNAMNSVSDIRKSLTRRL